MGSVQHPLTAKDRLAWKAYRALQSCQQDVRTRTPPGRRGEWYATMQAIAKEAPVPAALRDALAECLSQIANYEGEYAFEVAPRNLGVDAAGRLILLDVMFDQARIRERHEAVHARRAVQRRARGWR